MYNAKSNDSEIHPAYGKSGVPSLLAQGCLEFQPRTVLMDQPTVNSSHGRSFVDAL